MKLRNLKEQTKNITSRFRSQEIKKIKIMESHQNH